MAKGGKYERYASMKGKQQRILYCCREAVKIRQELQSVLSVQWALRKWSWAAVSSEVVDQHWSAQSTGLGTPRMCIICEAGINRTLSKSSLTAPTFLPLPLDARHLFQQLNKNGFLKSWLLARLIYAYTNLCFTNLLNPII